MKLRFERSDEMRAQSTVCRSPREAHWLAISATTLVLAAILFARPGKAEDMIVKYDQSEIIDLPRAVAEIIIGNPTIAEVTVHSPQQLVVTGKSFGITNLIALDRQKNVVKRARILVQRDEAKVVNLMRGGKRQSYNCSPQCNPTVTVGDDPTYFGEVSNAAKTKSGMATGTPGDAPADNQQ
jgi:hypothetical protein